VSISQLFANREIPALPIASFPPTAYNFYMKNISKVPVPGIIGGLGPASTTVYYNGIISGFREAVKEDIYPRIVINSVNMTDILADVAAKNYSRLTGKLSAAILQLKNAGNERKISGSLHPDYNCVKISRDSCRCSRTRLY
jgi:hypothetical protein